VSRVVVEPPVRLDHGRDAELCFCLHSSRRTEVLGQ
jgi:hypothetical protein